MDSTVGSGSFTVPQELGLLNCSYT